MFISDISDVIVVVIDVVIDVLFSILPIIGVLTALTSIITQVLKVTVKGLPPQITATVVSIVLSVIAYFWYKAVIGTSIVWYEIAGAIVGGFLVSFAAQFGFDKLREVLNKYTTGGK